uniref:Uncharacterized protein n=1 Tax=Anopheles atroparvus TaxID=41427 RepID=A0A182IX27_ANOAO
MNIPQVWPLEGHHVSVLFSHQLDQEPTLAAMRVTVLIQSGHQLEGKKVNDFSTVGECRPAGPKKANERDEGNRKGRQPSGTIGFQSRPGPKGAQTFRERCTLSEQAGRAVAEPEDEDETTRGNPVDTFCTWSNTAGRGGLVLVVAGGGGELEEGDGQLSVPPEVLDGAADARTFSLITDDAEELPLNGCTPEPVEATAAASNYHNVPGWHAAIGAPHGGESAKLPAKRKESQQQLQHQPRRRRRRSVAGAALATMMTTPMLVTMAIP